MFTPEVSIIIPCYNRAHIIKDTLNSVLNQSYKNWECVIVDDGSTDDSLIVLEHYKKLDSRFRYYNRPEQAVKGSSSCRNIGIKKSKGKYIIFLDSDDLLAFDSLENRVMCFKETPQFDFLVFQMEIFHEEIPDLKLKQGKQNLMSHKEIFNSFLRMRSEWQITCPIYKADFVKKIGGFSESLKIFTDLELGLRATYFSNSYQLYPIIDCFYRNDENYVTKRKTKTFLQKAGDSFYNYCLLFDKNIIGSTNSNEKKETLKRSFLMNYKKFFKTYVLVEMPLLFEQNKKILRYLIKQNYLTKSEKIRFSIVTDILLKAYKIKGFGLFRIINKLMQ
ncbi:glycosyltransferase family 2 protein [Pseudofulvibacter geojedonensis]|uniref:Glycosyltransferase family 2 protein n=1 Tax=Pseudofulvibacter geojedonensis TaxID=1123758 RepID=A0ABW3HYH3_9FLAO